MAGPIGEAYVQIRPDLSDFDNEVRRGVDRALDGVARQARSAGEALERPFREAARQVDAALNDVGGVDAFGFVVASAEAAGEQVDDSFREAARQADAALDNIGGADAFAPAVIGAELAGERIDNSFREAATQSNAALATIGATALVGVAALTAAVGAMAFVGVNSAADLGESINAINVTLGEGAESFLAFSENAADNLGITQAALNQAVIPMGALLRNAGLEGDALGDQLSGLAERAADVGSVMNKDVNEVLEAFGAAVRGEMEPARALGVSFNDAAVQAKALELGLVGAGEEADEAAKTQARLALIMEQTEQAAGDFANTADSLPNMLRRLRATGEEALQGLGTALIPGLQEAGNALLDNLPSLEPYLESVGTSLGGLVSTIAPLLAPLLGNVLSIISSLVAAFTPLAEAILGAVTPIVGGLAQVFAQVGPVLANVFGALAPQLAVIGAQFGQLLTYVAPLAAELIGSFAPVLGTILGVIGDLMPFFTAWVSMLSQRLGPILDVLVPIILDLAEAFGGALAAALPLVMTVAEALLDVLDVLLPIFAQIMDVVLEVAGALLDSLAVALGQILDAILPILPPLLELIAALADALLPVLPALLPAVLAIVDALAQLLVALLPLLVPLLQLVTIFVEQIGAPVLLAIAEAVAAIAGAVAGLVATIADVIGAITGDFDGFLARIQAIPGQIVSFLSSLPGIAMNLIGAAFRAARDAARGAIDEVIGFVQSIPGRIGGFVGAVAEAAAGVGRAIINGIADGISGAAGFVADVVSGLGRALTDMINTQVIDRINNAIPDKWELPGPVPDINLPDNPLPRLSFFAGGLVGGAPGEPVLAILHGGERVVPAGADYGGSTIVIEAINVTLPDGDEATARRAGRMIGDAAAQRLAELSLATTARLAGEA